MLDKLNLLQVRTEPALIELVWSLCQSTNPLNKPNCKISTQRTDPVVVVACRSLKPGKNQTMSSNSLLFALNTEGKVYALSANGSCWKEFMYLGIEFKTLSAVPHFLWAVGGDRQIYLHVHGLEIPIRVKEESYENERWNPIDGFSGRLLPTDRYHFSSQDGTKDRCINSIRLPSMAWQWEGDWQLELTLDGQPLDHDGWSYAVDFPAQFSTSKQWKSCVRRRKWIRYRKFCAMNSWCAIAPLHKDPTQEPFMDVCIGGDQMPYAPSGTLSVWALTAQGRIMFRTGVTYTSPEGLKWISISLPPNSEVKQISVGSSGLVWVVLWSGRALIRKGINKDCPAGETWLELKSPNETRLSHISVGFNSVWATSTDHKVWFRKGIDGSNAGLSESAALGSGWLEISGNMIQVSVGYNDQVFAIGESDKCIYWRYGTTLSELTGKRWRMIQANMQLSRTSSSASVVSNAKHSSIGGLSENADDGKPKINLHSQWEESHSAPIEHTLPLKPSKNKRHSAIENTDLTGKSYETTLKNPRAWSPVRSVGSVLGMEAHPESDSSVFDMDSGIFYDDDVNHTAWGLCDAAWAFVDAGACSIDTLQLPQWFSDSHHTVSADMNAKWRLDILNSLKKRYCDIDFDTSNFNLAIEEKGWTRSCEARLVNYSNHSAEDCILSFNWLSYENAGTLSVFNPDGAIKFIINICEICCITNSSEPAAPRITFTVPRESKKSFTVQFISEMEQEEWLSLLVELVAKVNEIYGKPSSKSVWTTTNTGDVLNWDPINTSSNETKTYTEEFHVAGQDTVAEFTATLHNHFCTGSEIGVAGCLFDEISRFHINLQGPESKKQRHKVETSVTEIPFHFNVRFDESVVVCNTKTSGVWGVEERHQLMMKPGQEFDIRIICTENGYKVIVNKHHYCYYEHRLPPETVTTVLVSGALKLFKLDYSSTTFILNPDETIWRMMGGHLGIVECCQDNVVWGISRDHRAWVYTGGWGGGTLKVGDSKEGIHPMSDTQVYGMYENQRWNPLSGYTSTGLPTDRHMWSDVTGRQKRSREYTKLINRHWHWISEWMIDYNTPGGVDADGWQYAMDFPAAYHGKKLFTDCVRRRRWYRKAQLATEGPWVRAGSTPLLDISLWGSGTDISMWAITVNGDAIYRTGVTTATPAGNHWEHVNSPQSFVAVSTFRRVVWVVGRKGEIFYRDGITDDCLTGTTWKLIEAPKSSSQSNKHSNISAKAVSLTAQAAWVVLSDGAIAVRTNVTPEQQHGKQWKLLQDNDISFKQVSVGEREVWAVSTSGKLYRRIGVTLENATGTVWQMTLDVGIHHVSARGVPF